MSHNLNLIDDGCIFHSISGKCVRFKECFSEEKDNCLKDIRFLYEKGNEHLTFFKINIVPLASGTLNSCWLLSR